MNGTGSGAPHQGSGAHGPGQGCPSDLALDAWMVGALDDAEQSRVEEAISTCDDCRAHSEDLRGRREAFLDSAASRQLEARLRERARARAAAREPFWRRWQVALGGVGVAAAAATALLMLIAAPPDPVTPPSGSASGTVSLKGGPLNVETFVRRDGAVLRLSAGEALRAGDAVGFRVTAGRAGWVSLFGTDGGVPVAIVPPGGGEAYLVPAGEPTQLPASAVLDAAGDAERFALVHCVESFRVVAAQAALASWAETGDDDGARTSIRRTLGSTCEVRTLTFPKP